VVEGLEYTHSILLKIVGGGKVHEYFCKLPWWWWGGGDGLVVVGIGCDWLFHTAADNPIQFNEGDVGMQLVMITYKDVSERWGIEK
jgi:hypothetical protein